MKTPSVRTIARLLWVFPLLLLGLGLYQADVARDLRTTLRHGQPATARVTGFESSDRVDITYDYVSLSVSVDGREIERERMSLPHSLAPLVEGREELAVVVRAGADQEIVIRDLGRTQVRIAWINAAMALFGAVFIGIGVGSWHWYLRRKGDPATRELSAAENEASGA